MDDGQGKEGTFLCLPIYSHRFPLWLLYLILVVDKPSRGSPDVHRERRSIPIQRDTFADTLTCVTYDQKEKTVAVEGTCSIHSRSLPSRKRENNRK